MEAVHVSFRFRGGEKDAQFAPVTLSETQVNVVGQAKPFNLDAAIDPQVDQDKVYKVTSQHVVQAFMDGFNGTIFAYGQSGSGKTFTMMGPEEVTEALMTNIDAIPQEVQELFGVIPKAVEHIFQQINQGIEKEQIQYTLLASYLEIYNEQINDIMACPLGKNLKVRELPNVGPTVMNLTQRAIAIPEEIFECIAMGTANKAVSSTNQNSRSSRSHTLFLLEIEQKYLSGTTKKSRINLVDLAGCEKISKTGAEGQTLEEAKKINLSLTTLGRVIKALTDEKEKFVPYRESKLTVILKESLGGNSKTSLICTASMKEVHLEETINTLRFAMRAKQIVCKTKANVQRSPAELEKIIDGLKHEIVDLKQKLVDGGQIVSSGGEGEEWKEKYISMEAEYEEYKNNSVIQIETLKDQLERVGDQENSIDHIAVMEQTEFLNEQIEEAKKRFEQSEAEKQQIKIELEGKIKGLQDENQQYKVQIEDVVKDCEAMDQQREKDKNTIHKLEQEKMDLQLNQDELQKLKESSMLKIQQLEEEKSNQRAELNKAKDEVIQISSECESLAQEMEATKNQLEQLNAKYEESKAGNAKQASQVEELEQEVQGAKQCQAELAEECEKLENQKNQFREQANDFQNQLAQEKTSNEALKSQMQNQNEEIAQLKKLLNESAGQQEILLEKDNYIEKMKQQYATENSKLSSQIDELNAKLQEVKSLNIIKDESEEKLQQKIKSMTQELSDTQQKFKDITTEFQESKSKCQDCNTKLDEARQVNEKLKADLRQANNKYDNEVGKLNNQIKDQESEIQQLKSEVAQLKANLEETQNQAKEKIKEEKNQRGELQKQIIDQKDDYEKQIKNLKQELNLKTQSMQSGEETIQRQQDKLNDIEMQLSLKITDLQKTKSELQYQTKQAEMHRRESIANKYNMSRNRGNSRVSKNMKAAITTTVKYSSQSTWGVKLKQTQSSHLQKALLEAKFSQEQEKRLSRLESQVEYEPQTAIKMMAEEEKKAQEKNENENPKDPKEIAEDVDEDESDNESDDSDEE